MNETEQMVMGFQSSVAKLNHSLSCVDRYTRSLPLMDDFQLRRALLFRRWDVHRFLKIVCRAAVECLAMAGCVLSAALATLLLGL
ncbi:hypothetical protein [Desulfosarcina ovata]|uniref:Uncharacterized protein n=1 Tax=Desulfosarcina ovata subsp. ovata TaxID=2752305 RepID=A0A5K8A547_9BACT|nr:hypothetical protein [Desulfosarcina ovata]BBO87621.1 hypothetical protein DSCOOX_08010 [Desulfosarcina ovata subsp. ovata]